MKVQKFFKLENSQKIYYLKKIIKHRDKSLLIVSILDRILQVATQSSTSCNSNEVTYIPREPREPDSSLLLCSDVCSEISSRVNSKKCCDSVFISNHGTTCGLDQEISHKNLAIEIHTLYQNLHLQLM